MISLISASDRPDSNTSKVSRNYLEIMRKHGLSPEYLSMESLPEDFFSTGKYGETPKSFEQVFISAIQHAERILMVVPEYNGSIPGVFKHFVDILPPGVWMGKKIAMAGVATGRAGNLRGLDHLTGIMHYLKAEVYHHKPLFSSIHLHLNAEANIVNEEYLKLIELQVSGFMKY